jgi:glycosyltransferase involved in cell wall biosynthesis
MATVSILIPVHNCEKHIGQCIESALAQADEVIVYDDASTDNTRDVIRQYPVAFHYGVSSVGAQKARNTLIQLASGDYLKFLDADDYLLPGNLNAQVGIAPVSYTNFLVEKYVNRRYVERYKADTNCYPIIESLLRFEWMPITGCFLFHKDIFKHVQWVDTGSYRYGMHDRRMTLDLLKAGIPPVHIANDGYVHRCGWSGSQIGDGERYMDARRQFTKDFYEWAKTRQEVCTTYDIPALESQTWGRIQTEENLNRC